MNVMQRMTLITINRGVFIMTGFEKYVSYKDEIKSFIELKKL